MTAPTISATPKKPLISGRHPDMATMALTPVLPEATSVRALSAQLPHTQRDPQRPVHADSDHIFVSGGQALSAGPARPAEILPRTAIRIALRIEGLRTRVFRRIELEHHPLRVRNARIRGRVQ